MPQLTLFPLPNTDPVPGPVDVDSWHDEVMIAITRAKELKDSGKHSDRKIMVWPNREKTKWAVVMR